MYNYLLGPPCIWQIFSGQPVCLLCFKMTFNYFWQLWQPLPWWGFVCQQIICRGNFRNLARRFCAGRVWITYLLFNVMTIPLKEKREICGLGHPYFYSLSGSIKFNCSFKKSTNWDAVTLSTNTFPMLFPILTASTCLHVMAFFISKTWYLKILQWQKFILSKIVYCSLLVTILKMFLKLFANLYSVIRHLSSSSAARIKCSPKNECKISRSVLLTKKKKNMIDYSYSKK